MKVKKILKHAKMPTQKQGDVGFDLYIAEIERKDALHIIHTGIALEIPNGYWGLIADRSSMGKKGFKVHGGVIDNSYRGEIIVILYNFNENVEQLTIGDKIAQLILIKQNEILLEESDELSQTERGDKGFGSTGK
jgi:deoxyuridine 5'-triphosphate nucleotidohydrolase